MGNEAGRSLQEAEKLLARFKELPHPLPKSIKIHIESVSRRLLEHFRDTAECRYFNAFYHLSKEVFHAYAFRHIAKMGASLDPEEMSNRLYVLLFEKILAPGEKIPLDYLFPWCYRVIKNLVREEVRKFQKPRFQIIESIRDPASSPQIDHLIAKEQACQNQERLERILDVLYSEGAGLSRRDRRIMRMFYLEDRSIQEIAEEMNLTKANVGVILMRSRKRIARRLAWKTPPSREKEEEGGPKA